MAMLDYISETEAASYTGVSSATLNRFAEAGYFKVEADSDGLKLFCKSELAKVFGLKSGSHHNHIKQPENQAEISRLVSELKTPSATSSGPLKASPQNDEPQADVSVDAAQISKTIEISLSSSNSTSSGTNPGKPVSEPLIGNPSEKSLNQEVESSKTEPSPLEIQNIELRQQVLRQERTVEILNQEALKLKNICDMQEKLLEMREQAINDLKQQRDWLRTRVQNWEDQTNRYQMLMMSEIQMTSKLIRLQAERRSTVQKALEWLGFTSRESNSSQAQLGATVDQQSQNR